MPNQEQRPTNYVPNWWTEKHDKLLWNSLQEDSFQIIEFKREVAVMAAATKADPDDVRYYDYDLDFVIDRAVYLKPIPPHLIEQRVLDDSWMRLEQKESSEIDVLCSRCPRPHNIYLDLRHSDNEGNAVYGCVRTGCCGRKTALMLTVQPWVYLAVIRRLIDISTIKSNHEDQASQTAMQEIFKPRHDAFLEWNTLRRIPTEGKTNDEVREIMGQVRDIFYQMVTEHGGTAIANVSRLFIPELVLRDDESSAEGSGGGSDDPANSYRSSGPT